MADTIERRPTRDWDEMRVERDDTRKAPLAWVPWVAGGLLALLALSTLVIAAVTSRDDDRGRLAATRSDCPTEREAGAVAFTSFDDVAGCRVDFVGTVTSVFDDNTFVVQSGSAQLVVVDGSRGSVRAAGQAVRVTGRADEWQFARIAPEIELQKDPADYARLEGQDVIVADVTVPAG